MPTGIIRLGARSRIEWVASIFVAVNSQWANDICGTDSSKLPGAQQHPEFTVRA